MAGSYEHCCDKNGNFIGDDFINMIENLGDAYEACEEMHWMINYLAQGNRMKIKEAETAYYDFVNKR